METCKILQFTNHIAFFTHLKQHSFLTIQSGVQSCWISTRHQWFFFSNCGATENGAPFFPLPLNRSAQIGYLADLAQHCHLTHPINCLFSSAWILGMGGLGHQSRHRVYVCACLTIQELNPCVPLLWDCNQSKSILSPPHIWDRCLSMKTKIPLASSQYRCITAAMY
jgi:hypothetical protein